MKCFDLLFVCFVFWLFVVWFLVYVYAMQVLNLWFGWQPFRLALLFGV